MVVVDDSDPPLFHYVRFGKNLDDELSRRYGSELVSAKAEADEVIGTLEDTYIQCARTRAPVYERADYDFGDGRPYHFERLILPLSQNGLTITHLLGIVLFDVSKEIAEDGVRIADKTEPKIDLPSFETRRLAEAIERLPEADVDCLPFGAIRLDSNGEVKFYSAAERRLSGYRKDVFRRPFFLEIAPCMNNSAFKGRIDRALAEGTLDIEFDHIGDANDAARTIRVRVQSASGGGCWLFLQREV